MTPARAVLPASCVAWDGRAALIRGAPGAGKSSLALMLMAWGCRLVADDGVEVVRDGDRLLARCPAPTRGLVECRGLGVLRADAAEGAVVVVADLDRPEPDRLPRFREVELLGVPVPCLHKPVNAHWAAGLLQYLKSGRVHPSPGSDP